MLVIVHSTEPFFASANLRSVAVALQPDPICVKPSNFPADELTGLSFPFVSLCTAEPP